MTTEQLQREWENYTRQVAGGSTSTAISVGLSPFTAGISLIGLGLSAPRIHNARKKREIIEAGLQARGTTHNTRKRDVAAPMAVSGVLGGLTFGLAGAGADIIAGEVAGKGFEYAVSHAALDGTGAVIEHVHSEHEKKSAAHKAHLKQQSFQQQYMQPQGVVQGQPQGAVAYPAYQPAQAVPQYQPQVPGQEPVYESVPIPAAHRHSIAVLPSQTPQLGQFSQPLAQAQIAMQPASHQQQLPQRATAPQINYYPPPMQRQNSLPAITEQSALQIPAPESEWITSSPKPVETGSGFSSQAGPIDTSYFPEKSPAYAASIPQLGQDQPSPGLTPCETPAPAYSEPASGQATPNDMKNGSAVPAMTPDEEIAFLKFRLLQMEMERRGQSLDVPPLNIVKEIPQTTVTEGREEAVVSGMANLSVQESETTVQQPSPQHPQHQITLSEEPQYQPEVRVTPPLGAQQPYQNYPPPSSTPLPGTTLSAAQYAPQPARTPSISVTAQYNQRPPTQSPTQQTNYHPLPNPTYQPTPDSTYQPQTQQPYQQPPTPVSYQAPPTSAPAPAPYTYNPQNYPPPPSTQPPYQRHDSGYYSGLTTPQPTSQQPTPSPSLYHGRSYSTASLVSPMSPPPPYFPPPPGANIGGGKDYFNQNQNAQPPYQPFQNIQPQQQQPYQKGQGYGLPPQLLQGGSQGWQWGAPHANPVPVMGQGQRIGEPNYGPPPAVPQAWRGS